jgi:hypothetical protein
MLEGMPEEEVISPSPRLYILSRPSFDIQEIERFEADERIVWKRTSDATPAEELIEFAGRDLPLTCPLFLIHS